MTTRYVDSAAAGANNGTSKVDAYTTFAACKAAMAAGDLILVSHTHVEPADASGATVTLAIPGTIASPSRIVSVNFGTDVPTQGAALYTTTGATPLIFNGVFRAWGCNVSVGSGAVTASLTLGTTAASVQLWQSCNLTLASTGASSNIVIGSATILCQWSNVTVAFGAIGQGFSVGSGVAFSWRNDSGVAALGGAIVPTALFKSTVGAIVRLNGLDLSAFNQGSGKAIFQPASEGDFEARNCRINCGVTTIAAPNNHNQLNGIDFINCRDGASVVSDYRARYQGSAATETTVVRTGGATSGAVPFSWKILTLATNKYDFPFVAFEVGLWNTVLTPQTLTIHILTDNVTLTDADIWVQAEYPGSAAYPLTSVISDRAAGDPIPAAANQAADAGTAWTTTGLVTPVKQKLEVTFTALLPGPVRFKIIVAKPATTVYVCPEADLS
jgi:hypothetical protein